MCKASSSASCTSSRVHPDAATVGPVHVRRLMLLSDRIAALAVNAASVHHPFDHRVEIGRRLGEASGIESLDEGKDDRLDDVVGDVRRAFASGSSSCDGGDLNEHFVKPGGWACAIGGPVRLVHGAAPQVRWEHRGGEENVELRGVYLISAAERDLIPRNFFPS